MDKIEEIGLLPNTPGQIVSFPSDTFSSNVLFTSDGTAVLGSGKNNFST